MKTKIWIALLALYIVWGSTYLAIRFAVETIPPFFQAGLRFFISGIILLIWRRLSGEPFPTSRQWRNTAVIGLLLLLGGNGLVSWAEQTIPSGIAALIIGAVPLVMVIAESLRPGGAKPSWQATLGLLVGFGGIYLLVGPSNISGGGTQLNRLGVVALLIACVLWSLGSVFSKSAELPKSSLMATGAEMVAGSIGLFIVSGITGEWAGYDVTAISLNSSLALLYLIFIGSLIGFVSYGWLLQNAPISLVSTYAYVNPVVAVLLGAWLAAEPLEPRILLAATIIIGSVILINFTKKPTSEIRVIKERVSECSSD